jgi:hypothetical protein
MSHSVHHVKKLIQRSRTVGYKKTGTVKIKLTRFYNFFIVENLLPRDRLELLWLKFNDIFKSYLISIVK